ncbi:unnamed protein product [Prunus armeniaca]|uniref:Uncharacterized protein n=1 Tax=Prunus armeniaca TaxID=36596 RepID=A0A6J5VQ91_PRUAR|nr:unnamed protein product [Prunus armeniaca]
MVADCDWSDLPQELVISIANRIVLMEDFTAFGAVCKSWRSAATKEIFTSRLTHQVPFIMHPVKDAAGMLEFYSFKKDKFLMINLPEGEDEVCGSCLGWLITKRGDSKFNLLHPLNHSRIKFPSFRDSKENLSPLIIMSNFDFKKRFVLSSSPSWTCDYTIMVQSNSRLLAFCKPTEHKYWTSIVLEEEARDIICYKGRFYAVSGDGSVWVCDTENPKQAKAKVVVPAVPGEVLPSALRRVKLVESAGDLLVVFTNGFRDDLPSPKFRVFKVPLRDGKWHLDLEVKDLGNRTLFLGRDSPSFSIVSSDCSGFKPNCIYFSFVLYGVFGVFHMEDGRDEEHFWSHYWRQPSYWIQPSF